MKRRLPQSNNLSKVKHKHMSAPQMLNQDGYVSVIRFHKVKLEGCMKRKDNRSREHSQTGDNSKTIHFYHLLYFKRKTTKRAKVTF